MNKPLGDPEDWSDSSKLRQLAKVLDKLDDACGKKCRTVQADLRRIAVDLEAHKEVLEVLERVKNSNNMKETVDYFLQEYANESV